MRTVLILRIADSQSRWFSYAEDEYKIIHQSNWVLKRCPDIEAKQLLILADSPNVLPSPGYKAAQWQNAAAADRPSDPTSSFRPSAAMTCWAAATSKSIGLEPQHWYWVTIDSTYCRILLL